MVYRLSNKRFSVAVVASLWVRTVLSFVSSSDQPSSAYLLREKTQKSSPFAPRIRDKHLHALCVGGQVPNDSYSTSSARWTAMADEAASFTRKMLAFAANGGGISHERITYGYETTETDFCEHEPHDSCYYNIEDAYNNPKRFGDGAYYSESVGQEVYGVEEDQHLMATDHIMQETVAFLQKDEVVTRLLGEPPLRLQVIGTSGDTLNFDVFGPYGSGIVSVVRSIFTGDLISIRLYFKGRRFHLFNGLNTNGAPVTTTASVQSKEKENHSFTKDCYVREDDIDFDEAVRVVEVEILEGVRQSSSSTKSQAIDADILDKDAI